MPPGGSPRGPGSPSLGASGNGSGPKHSGTALGWGPATCSRLHSPGLLRDLVTTVVARLGLGTRPAYLTGPHATTQDPMVQSRKGGSQRLQVTGLACLLQKG